MKKKTDKAGRKDKMYALVRRWDPEKQTRTAFSHAHGMSIHKFRYWYEKYRQETGNKESGFVPIRVKKVSAPEKPKRDTGLEIIYPSGVRVRLDELADAHYVGRLIKLGV